MSKSTIKPTIYLRYIDDVFGIWEHSPQQLEEFSQLANTIHPNIALTLRSNQSTIDFLDVEVSLNSDNTMSTKLYEKDTNAHMYVHKDSNHPKATKDNIAYGLALRSRRICSNDIDYERSKRQIESNLILRGHTKNTIKEKISKADGKNREELLTSSS